MLTDVPIEFGSLNTYTASRKLKAHESTLLNNFSIDKIVGELISLGPFTKSVYSSGVTTCYLYNGEFFVQCGTNLYIDGVLSLTLTSSERLSYVPVINVEGDTYLLVNNVGGSYKYTATGFAGLGTDAPSAAPAISNAITSFNALYTNDKYAVGLGYAMDYNRNDSLEDWTDGLAVPDFNPKVNHHVVLLYSYNPDGEKVQLAPIGNMGMVEFDGQLRPYFAPTEEAADDGTPHMGFVLTEETLTHSDSVERTTPYAQPYGNFNLPAGTNIKLRLVLTPTRSWNAGDLKIHLGTKYSPIIPYSGYPYYYQALDHRLETLDCPAITSGIDNTIELSIDPSATDYFGNGYESLLYISFEGVTGDYQTTYEFDIKDFGFFNADQLGTLDIDSAFYIYTYKNSGTGTESSASPAPLYDGIRTRENKVGVNVIASSDSQIDQILLYRLDSATSGDYKLVATLTNTTQTYWDNIASASLGATFSGDYATPPVPGLKQLTYLKNKVFGFKDNILYNSENNNPESWGDGVSNQTQIGDQNDILTCNALGNTIILTKKDTPFIFVVNVVGNAPFEIAQIPIESIPIGDTAISTSGGVIYLSTDGIHKFNGFTSENISIPVSNKFQGVSSSLFKYAEKIYCLNPSIIIDELSGFKSGFNMVGLSFIYDANGSIYYCFSNGTIYKSDNNNGDIYPFSGEYRSKDFLFDVPHKWKEIRECTIEVESINIINFSASASAITGNYILDIGGNQTVIGTLNYDDLIQVNHTITHEDIRIYPEDAAFSISDLQLTISVNGVAISAPTLGGDWSSDAGGYQFTLNDDVTSTITYADVLAIVAYMDFYSKENLVYTKTLMNGVNEFSLPYYYKGTDLRFGLRGSGGLKFKTPSLMRVTGEGE